MRTMSVREARRSFGDLLSRVHFTGEPCAITRHGKTLATLVPVARPEGGDGKPDDGRCKVRAEAPAPAAGTEGGAA